MANTYFLLDSNNMIIGAYTEGINQIPQGAIKVSEEVAIQRLNDSAFNCYENGKLIKKDIRTPEELEEQKLNDKWALVNQYLSQGIPNITITETGHEFIVRGKHIQDIKDLEKESSNEAVINFIQFGIPTFETTWLELGMVIKRYGEIKQAKINEIFELGV